MIERAEFGRTGHLSSRVIFGAAAVARMSEEKAGRILPLLTEYGINHIDTAAAYGESELRVGRWMADHRDDFFLATKTGERSGAGARASLERSLERLRVDHVDLVQLHNLVEEDEWQEAFAPGGAVEALSQARDEGLTRFVGVTGHGLRIAGMHLRSLERHDFDSVLLPYNYSLYCVDAYRSDFERLVDLCSERRVAVQTIKSVARRRWVDQNARKYSWYEPISDAAARERAVNWVLGDQRVFLNTSSDATLLPDTLRVASSAGNRPSDEEMDADVRDLQIEPLFDGSELERI
jgi:aryl-alcohol dehydrogenase-like predicted oxidoreductase